MIKAMVATLGSAALVAWVLMLLPSVNDAVLGDKPRERKDFARMCEGGEPFPRAASYEPGSAPHPWVVIEDGWDPYSSMGTTKKESAGRKDPDPDSVQLVACSAVSGSIPDTDIPCVYDRHGVGAATMSIKFAQGRSTVYVREARTGDLIRKAVLEGDEKVECSETVTTTEPDYTRPNRDAYVDLFAEVAATRDSP
ncbi:hypothetical protein ACFVW8_29485 [Streptomyces sp. NPDC058221]|uniref:hypothetical protein n=1 Tax=Streptomyces sp. NPDC058221 TaxID=3346388 RepID=UPI0036E25216